MNQMALPKMAPPAALHRAETDLPFVTFFEGLDFQLLQASVENGLWVVRTRFQPNVTSRRTGTPARCSPSPSAGPGATSNIPR